MVRQLADGGKKVNNEFETLCVPCLAGQAGSAKTSVPSVVKNGKMDKWKDGWKSEDRSPK
jgi:hypothetical protein